MQFEPVKKVVERGNNNCVSLSKNQTKKRGDKNQGRAQKWWSVSVSVYVSVYVCVYVLFDKYTQRLAAWKHGSLV